VAESGELDMTQVNTNGANVEDTAHYETRAFAPGVAFAWTLRSAEIAHRKRNGNGNGNGATTQRAVRYENPIFAPGVAFAWTLRSAEIARRNDPQQRNRRPDSSELNALVAA
jgi:hypothetical protein